MSDLDRRTVSLEIGQGVLKIAEARTVRGRRQIANLLAVSLTANDDAKMAEEIRQAVQSMDISSARVQLNIPRHLVTVRFLSLPSTDEREILDMIKIESTKYIPYTDENVIYGCRIIERYEDGYSKVLLAIAQAKTIYDSINLLKRCGVGKIECLALSSESLFVWYTLTSEPEETKSIMLVNLDSDHMDVDVAQAGRLLFTRGVLLDAGSHKRHDRMLGEIKVSITTYQKESNRPIDKVILSGTENDIRECHEILAKELNVPVETVSQMKGVPLAQGGRVDTDSASFTELSGLSLRPEDMKVNLMPQDIKEAARIELSKSNLVLALTLLVLIISIAFGLVIKKLYDKAAHLSYITRQAKEMDPKVARTRKMMKDIAVIKNAMAKKPLAIDMIGEIYRMTPPNISLTMLEYESKKSLTVRGLAQALGEVFRYVTILEGSQYLEGVKVKYANKRMLPTNKEVADFEISCALSKIK